MSCLHNVLNVPQVEELLGLHNRSSQQMKFEVAEKQQSVQTVHKFVQQCWFFQSETITNKFADQADNIAPFTNPFSFPKEKINQLEVNVGFLTINLKCSSVLKSRFAELPVIPTENSI